MFNVREFRTHQRYISVNGQQIQLSTPFLLQHQLRSYRRGGLQIVCCEVVRAGEVWTVLHSGI